MNSEFRILNSEFQKIAKSSYKGCNRFEFQHREFGSQMNLQEEIFKVKLENQKPEKLAHARDPKLPYVDERKDKMDSYLSRFEKYATTNEQDSYAMAAYLGALLKDRDLDLYDRFPAADAAGYEKLKYIDCERILM